MDNIFARIKYSKYNEPHTAFHELMFRAKTLDLIKVKDSQNNQYD